MQRILFSFPGNEMLGQQILGLTGMEEGMCTVRRFPDGESYIRLSSEVRGKEVVALCTLCDPDDKIMMLYFFTKLARESGASKVIMLAPYLGYMRQDKAFKPGEAVTSAMFASLISKWFDALITIDPHLHRHKSMEEIYSIPAIVLHTKAHIARYIKTHIETPVIIGPDQESKQWVAETSGLVGCDFLVMKKERKGDREVSISVPGAVNFKHHTPVLVDDIISTGVTMSEAVRHLKDFGLAEPVCIGIHGIFAQGAYELLESAGASDIVTTNTITHRSNRIDITDMIAAAFDSWSLKYP